MFLMEPVLRAYEVWVGDVAEAVITDPRAGPYPPGFSIVAGSEYDILRGRIESCRG